MRLIEELTIEEIISITAVLFSILVSLLVYPLNIQSYLYTISMPISFTSSAISHEIYRVKAYLYDYVLGKLDMVDLSIDSMVNKINIFGNVIDPLFKTSFFLPQKDLIKALANVSYRILLNEYGINKIALNWKQIVSYYYYYKYALDFDFSYKDKSSLFKILVLLDYVNPFGFFSKILYAYILTNIYNNENLYVTNLFSSLGINITKYLVKKYEFLKMMNEEISNLEAYYDIFVSSNPLLEFSSKVSNGDIKPIILMYYGLDINFISDFIAKSYKLPTFESYKEAKSIIFSILSKYYNTILENLRSLIICKRDENCNEDIYNNLYTNLINTLSILGNEILKELKKDILVGKYIEDKDYMNLLRRFFNAIFYPSSANLKLIKKQINSEYLYLDRILKNINCDLNDIHCILENKYWKRKLNSYILGLFESIVDVFSKPLFFSILTSYMYDFYYNEIINNKYNAKLISENLLGEGFDLNMLKSKYVQNVINNIIKSLFFEEYDDNIIKLARFIGDKDLLIKLLEINHLRNEIKNSDSIKNVIFSIYNDILTKLDNIDMNFLINIYKTIINQYEQKLELLFSKIFGTKDLLSLDINDLIKKTSNLPEKFQDFLIYIIYNDNTIENIYIAQKLIEYIDSQDENILIELEKEKKRITNIPEIEMYINPSFMYISYKIINKIYKNGKEIAREIVGKNNKVFNMLRELNFIKDFSYYENFKSIIDSKLQDLTNYISDDELKNGIKYVFDEVYKINLRRPILIFSNELYEFLYRLKIYLFGSSIYLSLKIEDIPKSLIKAYYKLLKDTKLTLEIYNQIFSKIQKGNKIEEKTIYKLLIKNSKISEKLTKDEIEKLSKYIYNILNKKGIEGLFDELGELTKTYRLVESLDKNLLIPSIISNPTTEIIYKIIRKIKEINTMKTFSGFLNQHINKIASKNVFVLLIKLGTDLSFRASLNFLASSIIPPPSVLPDQIYTYKFVLNEKNKKLLEGLILYDVYLTYFYFGKFFTDSLYSNKNPYPFIKLLLKPKIKYKLKSLINLLYFTPADVRIKYYNDLFKDKSVREIINSLTSITLIKLPPEMFNVDLSFIGVGNIKYRTLVIRCFDEHSGKWKTNEECKDVILNKDETYKIYIEYLDTLYYTPKELNELIGMKLTGKLLFEKLKNFKDVGGVVRAVEDGVIGFFFGNQIAKSLINYRIAEECGLSSLKDYEEIYDKAVLTRDIIDTLFTNIPNKILGTTLGVNDLIQAYVQYLYRPNFVLICISPI